MASHRTFITGGERAKGTVFYWDTSLFSTLFAMLEPKQMIRPPVQLHAAV